MLKTCYSNGKETGSWVAILRTRIVLGMCTCPGHARTGQDRQGLHCEGLSKQRQLKAMHFTSAGHPSLSVDLVGRAEE